MSPRKRRTKRTWIGRIAAFCAWSLLITISVSILAAWILYRSAQRVPDFYAAALATAPATLQSAGSEFERNVAQLKNNTVQTGIWQAVFTQDQINGWLQFDLNEKFPGSLPPNVSNPRIAITKGDVKLAFGVKAKNLSGIVVASGNLFCTDKKNQIGVHIKSVSSGLIPISIERWANKISARLRERNIAMTWSEIDGDPVALITLPVRYQGSDDVEIKGIEIDDQKIVLIGETLLRSSVSADLGDHSGQIPHQSEQDENSTTQR